MSAHEAALRNSDFWLEHDDDLRYVHRVLEAGKKMTEGDRAAAIAIIYALRVTVRHIGVNQRCATYL